MSTTSIDDILMGEGAKNRASHPQTPEYEPDISAELESPDEPEVPRETSNEYAVTDEPEEPAESAKPAKPAEIDDYGNEKASPRTYTEDELNERINHAVRDRLARAERNNGQQTQPTQQQVQQATSQGFEYNAESNESWQQQLEQFVEQTVSRMGQRQTQQAHQQREQQEQAAFEDKFRQGMGKFQDFTQVVAHHPVTDAMTMALRGVSDPAAFLYAAAKREPKELERISQIRDPYTQIAEMGKLEERMKKGKPASKTPKPIGRTQEDLAIPHKSSKQPSLEELIAKDAAKRLALQKQRRHR